MFLILYISSSFEMDLSLDGSITHGYYLKQALSPKEKTLFKTRLKVLEENQSMDFEDMLSFVIMAENFKDDSDYVRKVVENALYDMKKVYSRQADLLLYLSVLKYFGDMHLPAIHCRKIAFPLLSDSTIRDLRGKTINIEDCDMAVRDLQDFSPQAKLFLKENSDTSGGARFALFYHSLEIAHRPVAFQVYSSLLPHEEDLANVVTKLLSEKGLTDRSQAREFVLMTLRKLLCKRQIIANVDDDKYSKGKYSPLIQRILDTSSRESARAVLRKGYETVNDDNKSYIAQTLSRMHNEFKEFEEAKQWAEKAVQDAPENFTCVDTLGQVYKKELK